MQLHQWKRHIQGAQSTSSTLWTSRYRQYWQKTLCSSLAEEMKRLHSTSHRYVTDLCTQLSWLSCGYETIYTCRSDFHTHTQLHILQVVRRPTKHKGKMNLNPVPPLSKDEPPMKIKFDGGNAFAKLPKRDKRAPRPGARIEEAFPKWVLMSCRP